MPAAEGKAQFLGEVFAAELEEIGRRRREADSGQPADFEPGPPDVRRDLVGLALSGGGIRSATFALGALQALANRGLLKRVDYLSTVSGGGFAGACLSATLNSRETRAEGESFPLRFEAGREEPPAVVHLRNSGNYLAPAGVVDKFRLGAVVLRGLLLNLLLFTPYVMIAVVLTEIVHEHARSGAEALRLVPLALLAAFLALVVTFPLVSKLLRLRRLTWRSRNTYERVFALVLLLAVAMLALVPVLLVIDEAILLSWEEVKEEIVYEAKHAFEADDPLHWLLPLGILIALMLSVAAVRRSSRRRDRIGLYLLGLLAPALLFAVYLVLCTFQIDSPLLYSRTVAHFEIGAPGVFDDAKQLEELLRPALAARGERLSSTAELELLPGERAWRILDEKRETVLRAEEDADDGLVRVLHDLRAELRNHWFSAGLRHEFEDRGLAGAVAAMRVEDHPVGWRISDGGELEYLIRDENGRLVFDHLETDLWDQGDEVFVGVGVGLLLFSFLFVNVNQTSSHGFYRDRLSRAYLLGARRLVAVSAVLDAAEDLDAGVLPEMLRLEIAELAPPLGPKPRVVALEPGGRWLLESADRSFLLVRKGERLEIYRSLEPADALRLSGLASEGTAAPYHLLNVALNLQGSDDPGLRGRNADFFVFGKRFCGGPRTGYCKTEDLERADRHLDLGTAMAISAAAAAPNMGAISTRSVGFVLALLNVRLGYWLPNPRWLRSQSAWRRLIARTGVGPRHLIQEALGRVDDRGAFVNLSDGGHLENLGVYELLRRRCRLIVAVDAEADRGHGFGGLVNLIRVARIDLGVEIKIALDPLRRDAAGRSAAHWALGRIHYGRPEEGATGYLLYLKASVTGDEDDDVLDYQARNPDFPHESTAEQFFSEVRFEAYRALGYHAADGLGAALASADGGGELADLPSALRLTPLGSGSTL